MLPLLASIAACNSVLGIREALPQDWDGAPYVANDSGAAGASAALANDDTGAPSGAAPDAGASSAAGMSIAPLLDAAAIWADWPMPNPPSLTDLPNPQKYDTSMSGVVIDRVTGLQWQAAPGGTGTPATMTWSDAATYCSGLPTAGGGWRLPSRIELISIVDYTQPEPTLDSAAFTGSPAGGYWTASPLAGSAGTYWIVDFSGSPNLIVSSTTSSSDGGPVHYYARCVRSLDAQATVGGYVVADGSVTDAKTKLTWQQSVPSMSYSHTGALAYCAALTTAGASWRVPSLGELQTLIDESVQSPSIDPTAFPNTPADFFWTSSNGPSVYRGYVYGVSFISGFTTLWNEGTLRRVRCVH